MLIPKCHLLPSQLQHLPQPQPIQTHPQAPTEGKQWNQPPHILVTVTGQAEGGDSHCSEWGGEGQVGPGHQGGGRWWEAWIHINQGTKYPACASLSHGTSLI